MSVLPAQSIMIECHELPPMIHPFRNRTVAFGKTYGLSGAGYDIRIAETILMWPKSFKLASAIEKFDMPDDVVAIVHDKSSWARKGLTVQNTVIEPGWRGYLTLELTNHTWRFIHLCAGMPIAQIIFHRLEQVTSLPYSGKYQDQSAGAQKAIDEFSV